jgi:hypothetical protein
MKTPPLSTFTGCSEKPTTEIARDAGKLAIVYGRVTTETGELPAADTVVVIPGTQDPSCTGQLFTAGTKLIGRDGRYRTVTGVPGFVPSRQCLKVIFKPEPGGPWQEDTVNVGLITLRYEDRGVPLDSVRVDFVLRRKE